MRTSPAAATLFITAIVALAAPTYLGAQQTDYQFKRQGIFDCAGGEFAGSVGARAATQAAYVPVNDAAVTINTYQLLYKECVLIELVARQREVATASALNVATKYITTGRNGEPLWPRVIELDRAAKSDAALASVLQGPAINAYPPEIRDALKRGLAVSYRNAQNVASSTEACALPSGTAAYSGSNGRSVMANLAAFRNPACVPFSAQMIYNKVAYERVSSDLRDMELELQRNGGIYDQVAIGPDGIRQVVTPGSILRSNYTQVLQSGFKQLENADDIGQMVGALFSGITTHVLGDTQGLLGLTQSRGGQLSYLDQVARDAVQGLRTVATNVGLQTLSTWKQVETAYYQVIRAIAELLVRSMSTIRAQEARCYELIIERVCDGGGAKHGDTCTNASSTKFKIDTEKHMFANKVIGDNIQSIASSTAVDLAISETALQKIDQMIATVSNTTSPDAQRAVLEQLDDMVARRQIHTDLEVREIQKSLQDTASAMATLIEDVAKLWGDSPDPSVGWCNVNNPAVINYWENEWKFTP